MRTKADVTTLDFLSLTSRDRREIRDRADPREHAAVFSVQ
jgi:hypothetical protein